MLSEYIRSAVYDDETSILEEQSDRPKKCGKQTSTIRKRWREDRSSDRSDSDGIEGTVESLASMSAGYLQ